MRIDVEDRARIQDTQFGAYPTMDSLRAIADGVESLDSMGLDKPPVIRITNEMPSHAFAGYDFNNDVVEFHADYAQSRIEQLASERFLVGDPSSATAAAMLHEMGHRSHYMVLRDEYKDAPGGPVDAVRALMGRPFPFIGPTEEPWAPDIRIARNTQGDGGLPADYARARSIAGEVSGYARMNPLEFVAETRVGLLIGKRYSDEVMSLYRDYGGPDVKPARPSKKTRAA
jgi:hypothetical protein